MASLNVWTLPRSEKSPCSMGIDETHKAPSSPVRSPTLFLEWYEHLIFKHFANSGGLPTIKKKPRKRDICNNKTKTNNTKFTNLYSIEKSAWNKYSKRKELSRKTRSSGYQEKLSTEVTFVRIKSHLIYFSVNHKALKYTVWLNVQQHRSTLTLFNGSFVL